MTRDENRILGSRIMSRHTFSILILLFVHVWALPSQMDCIIFESKNKILRILILFTHFLCLTSQRDPLISHTYFNGRSLLSELILLEFLKSKVLPILCVVNIQQRKNICKIPVKWIEYVTYLMSMSVNQWMSFVLNKLYFKYLLSKSNFVLGWFNHCLSPVFCVAISH
jgi:hypothetical protein